MAKEDEITREMCGEVLIPEEPVGKRFHDTSREIEYGDFLDNKNYEDSFGKPEFHSVSVILKDNCVKHSFPKDLLDIDGEDKDKDKGNSQK